MATHPKILTKNLGAATHHLINDRHNNHYRYHPPDGACSLSEVFHVHTCALGASEGGKAPHLPVWKNGGGVGTVFSLCDIESFEQTTIDRYDIRCDEQRYVFCRDLQMSCHNTAYSRRRSHAISVTRMIVLRGLGDMLGNPWVNPMKLTTFEGLL